jgi:hypothetical protein
MDDDTADPDFEPSKQGGATKRAVPEPEAIATEPLLEEEATGSEGTTRELLQEEALLDLSDMDDDTADPDFEPSKQRSPSSYASKLRKTRVVRKVERGIDSPYRRNHHTQQWVAARWPCGSSSSYPQGKLHL